MQTVEGRTGEWGGEYPAQIDVKQQVLTARMISLFHVTLCSVCVGGGGYDLMCLSLDDFWPVKELFMSSCQTQQ